MSNKKKDFSSTLFSAGGLVLVFLILLLLNVIFSRVNLHIDGTEENLYSISDASKNIISQIKEPITIKLFYSKSIDNMPIAIKNFAPRIIDFLSEYKTYAKGKIVVETYNPKMDSEEEEWAKQYGIKGIDLPTGDVVYLGMVVIAADQEETLSFMDPSRERHLEYDISRAISKVLSPKKPKIGVLSGLEIFGNPPSPVPMPGEPPESPPWYFLTELRKSYDVVDLSMSSNYIDNNLDLLILVYTKYLSEPLQYAVDQYVLNGGRLIIFVDPFALSDRSADFEKECTFDLLFKNLGISIDSHKALIDFGHATQYMDKNNQIIENPFWLTFDKNSLNQDNIITGQLESLLFAITGVIQKDGSRNIQYDPLVT